jgi:hypothetical protein
MLDEGMKCAILMKGGTLISLEHCFVWTEIIQQSLDEAGLANPSLARQEDNTSGTGTRLIPAMTQRGCLFGPSYDRCQACGLPRLEPR